MQRGSVHKTFWAGMLIAVLAITGPMTPAAVSADAEDVVSINRAETLGGGSIEGDLQVLLIENVEISSKHTDPRFSLMADELRLETDRSDVSTQSTRPFVGNENREFTNVQVEGSENRDNHLFSVWPMDENVSIKTVDSACTSINPSDKQIIDRTPLVDSAARDSNKTHVGNALNWIGCGDNSTIMASGDFLVRLWEWDAELTAEGERETLRSGQQNHEDVPEGIPDMSMVAGQAQEQFLYATNATLFIPRLDGYHEVFLKGATLNATNGYRLVDTTGSLLGISLTGQEVTADGDGLLLHVGGNGLNEPMSAFFEGAHRSAQNRWRIRPDSPPGLRWKI